MLTDAAEVGLEEDQVRNRALIEAALEFPVEILAHLIAQVDFGEYLWLAAQLQGKECVRLDAVDDLVLRVKMLPHGIDRLVGAKVLLSDRILHTVEETLRRLMNQAQIDATLDV